MDTEARIVL